MKAAMVMVHIIPSPLYKTLRAKGEKFVILSSAKLWKMMWGVVGC